jgi:hypothetical protein
MLYNIVSIALLIQPVFIDHLLHTTIVRYKSVYIIFADPDFKSCPNILGFGLNEDGSFHSTGTSGEREEPSELQFNPVYDGVCRFSIMRNGCPKWVAIKSLFIVAKTAQTDRTTIIYCFYFKEVK